MHRTRSRFTNDFWFLISFDEQFPWDGGQWKGQLSVYTSTTFASQTKLLSSAALSDSELRLCNANTKLKTWKTEDRKQKTGNNGNQWSTQMNRQMKTFYQISYLPHFARPLSYHIIISYPCLRGSSTPRAKAFPDNLINCPCHACIFIFRNWLWCGLEMGVGPRPHLAHYHQPLRIELFLWPLIPYVLHFARPDGSLMSHLGFAELLMTIPRIKDMRKYSIST